MDENSIRNLTLASWAAGVWEKELRGVSLQFQDAALAFCMRQHAEWREYWNRLGGAGADNAKVVSILVHIYNDAAVKLQIDTTNPPEINSEYQKMRAKGIPDMDALHVIAAVLQEHTWNTTNKGESFDMPEYVERVKRAVETHIQHTERIRKGA